MSGLSVVRRDAVARCDGVRRRFDSIGCPQTGTERSVHDPLNPYRSDESTVKPNEETLAPGPARLWRWMPRANDGRPPVLLVHGGYHGAWCWSNWAERLAGHGRRVSAIDLRGHGGLARPDGFITAGFTEMTDDVIAAIDTFEVPPLLVGHSIGGLLVVLAAIRRSTAGLLLVCPSPPGNLPGAATVPLVPENAPVPPLSAAIARARYAPHLSEREAAAFAHRLCAESPRLLNERYGLRIAVNPTAITVPVHVVEGGRDDPERHPPGQDAAIARFLGGTHQRLDDAPHNLMLGPGWHGWYDTIWARVDSVFA